MRLAKEADLPAESICADRDLEKMVKSETVSQNLPAAVKANLKKPSPSTNKSDIVDEKL